MTVLRTMLLAGSAAASLAASTPARAALVQVTSLSGTNVVFSDAPGATYGAGMPVSFTTAGQTVTFTAPGNTLQRNSTNTYFDSNYADGTQLIGPCGYGNCNSGGSLSLAFLAPVLGFSIAADDFDTTQSFTFQATAFSGNAVLGRVTASSLADNGALPAVLAATSTMPITSISISDIPIAGGAGTGSFVIGDIITVPVPEPSSIALLAGVLAGLIGFRGRRLNR